MSETIIQQAIDKMIQSDPDLVRRTIIDLLIRETELKERIAELQYRLFRNHLPLRHKLGGKISHK